MGYRIITEAVKLRYRPGPKMGARKAILVQMAEFADKEGKNVYVSEKLLADLTGWSVATVRRCKADLLAQRWILRDGKHHYTDKFALNFELCALTVEMVEHSIRRKGKGAREEAPPDEPSAPPFDATPPRPPRPPLTPEEQIARARENVVTYRERIESARAVGNTHKASAIELNLWGAEDRLNRLLKQQKQQARKEERQI